MISGQLCEVQNMTLHWKALSGFRTIAQTGSVHTLHPHCTLSSLRYSEKIANTHEIDEKLSRSGISYFDR